MSESEASEKRSACDELKSDFIESLNEDLSKEFQSIVQYVTHIATIKGARYQQTLIDMEQHLNQELQHALILARQIDFLGGTPVCKVPPGHQAEDPESALKADLSLENAQLSSYRVRVEQANELGLPDVAEALSPILEQTQDHVRDLQAVLDS